MLKQHDNRITRADRKAPAGPRMEWIDYLRAWTDDFLGRTLHGQYASDFAGAGSIIPTLQDGFHGGVVRLTSGAAAARYSRLWLGDAADGFDTLTADEGWRQITRMRLNVLGGSYVQCLGTANVAQTRRIRGAQGAALANWNIECTDVAGNSNTDTGIAIDTDWHWHTLDVFPITGGRQVDYYLDNVLRASQTTNVPTEVLTANIWSRSGDATLRSMDVDFWAVIAR